MERNLSISRYIRYSFCRKGELRWYNISFSFVVLELFLNEYRSRKRSRNILKHSSHFSNILVTVLRTDGIFFYRQLTFRESLIVSHRADLEQPYVYFMFFWHTILEQRPWLCLYSGRVRRVIYHKRRTFKKCSTPVTLFALFWHEFLARNSFRIVQITCFRRLGGRVFFFNFGFFGLLLFRILSFCTCLLGRTWFVGHPLEREKKRLRDSPLSWRITYLRCSRIVNAWTLTGLTIISICII